MESPFPVLVEKKQSSSRHSQTLLLVLILGIAFLGLTNSWYLATIEVSGDPLICNVLDGCNLVAESPYSKLFGIPLSFFGVAFYFLTIASAFGYLILRHRALRAAIGIVTAAGFLASLWFVYLQVFMIKALCEYCITSAVLATILLLLSYTLRQREENVDVLR